MVPNIRAVRQAAIALSRQDSTFGIKDQRQLGDGSEFDGKSLARAVYEQLPPYALPLFVRVVESIEQTSTFKSRKVELRDQGYGSEDYQIEDPLYVLAGRDEGYVPFYDDYPDEVAAGKRPQG